MIVLQFTKTVTNVGKLHLELGENFSKYEYFTQKANDLKIFFNSALTQVEINDVTAYINTFVEVSLFDEYVYDTQARQIDGINLFQKIYADLMIENTFSTVDASISGYDVLIRLRCMLKDGSGKSALRYLTKHIGANGIFPTNQYEKIKLWLEDYCYKYRVSSYASLTREQYNNVLIAIETAENI